MIKHSNSNKQVINVDDFARSLESIFGDVDEACNNALVYGITEGAKKTKSEWKARAPRSGVSHNGRKAYADSITYKVERLNKKPRAVVYSRVPGLPHLLEKGHALIGGGYWSPKEKHIEPAAEEGFRVALEAFEKKVDEEL